MVDKEKFTEERTHVFQNSRDLPGRQRVLIGKNIMCKGTEAIQERAFDFWSWGQFRLPVLIPGARRPRV